MDVAGESSTDKPAARPAAQPPVDVDAAGAIPEDNFTKYDLQLFTSALVSTSLGNSGLS